jgi:hypothetical protein
MANFPVFFFFLFCGSGIMGDGPTRLRFFVGAPVALDEMGRRAENVLRRKKLRVKSGANVENNYMPQ